MRHIKKLMAAVLVAVMALALGSALALADPPTGSITMDTSADGTVAAAGKTFKAYKVLDVTYDEDNYAYTIPESPAALKSKLATEFNVSAKGANESDIAYEQRIVSAIETAANADVEAVAKKLLKVAKEAEVPATNINGTTAATGLALGYYVIEDVTSSGTNQKPVSAVALTTTNPDVTINVKATKPTLDKSIDEGTTTGEMTIRTRSLTIMLLAIRSRMC